MTKQLKKGDHVTWNTSQGSTSGTVVAKVTKTTKIKDYTAKASPEHPDYKVKSDKTEAEAIHKANALSKKK
jgi:hypothetical protein